MTEWKKREPIVYETMNAKFKDRCTAFVDKAGGNSNNYYYTIIEPEESGVYTSFFPKSRVAHGEASTEEKAMAKCEQVHDLIHGDE